MNWSAQFGSVSVRALQKPAISDLFFDIDLLGEFDRLQRQMATLFAGTSTSLRATRLGIFPPVSIGSTDDSVEIVTFAPGLDPTRVDVSTNKGLLTISGEHRRLDFEMTDDTRVYADERFADASRRIIKLLQDVSPDKVNARYVNSCLTISISKSKASKPRQITV